MKQIPVIIIPTSRHTQRTDVESIGVGLIYGVYVAECGISYERQAFQCRFHFSVECAPTGRGRCEFRLRLNCLWDGFACACDVFVTKIALETIRSVSWTSCMGH